jgi:asparagine synthase (glutamine-hydrolysing)
MCGIVATPAPDRVDITPAVQTLSHRGPDAAAMELINGVMLGHTRLAIQDPGPQSDQPFCTGGITISYNGELFNADSVRNLVNVMSDRAYPWRTDGDTEVIAAALSVLGPDAALRAFDGMFAVAWADESHPGVLFVARDRQGEIPLHVHRGGRAPVVASELKAFGALGRRCGEAVVDVGPGQWWAIESGGHITRHTFHWLIPKRQDVQPVDASDRLRAALSRAVDRRMISDVPICSLLSGGIDSAVIAYELAKRTSDLVCYTAVLDPKSRDLRCARQVAGSLGVTLVEVPVPVPSADDLSAVVGHIELPFKAQIEIGWACLALARRIRDDGFKVTFTGEGSDELWASYGFAYHGLKSADWHTYRRDLILDQARKNFPRVNKSFMAHGVEGRLPFLDPEVVDFALGLPRISVQNGPGQPKAVLQRAYRDVLPAAVIDRPKVAFQDGMGLKSAITKQIANPTRYYRAEHRRLYG